MTINDYRHRMRLLYMASAVIVTVLAASTGRAERAWLHVVIATGLTYVLGRAAGLLYDE